MTAVGAALAAAAPAAAAPRLVDVSREAGIFNVSLTWSAEVGDINGDRWDDLLVINHYDGDNPVDLYRNNRNGTFTEIDTGPGTFPKKDRHDCAFGDVNNDGREDLYCTIGGGRGAGRNANELYIQQPGGTFVDEAGDWGVKDLNGRGRDTTFIDVNNDGLLDLYVGNKFPRSDGRRSKNKLYINVGGERFRHAPEYGLTRQVGGKVVQRIDYDRDGFDDLFVCGERHAFLYRNIRGRRFENVTRKAVKTPCEGALMARINGDGRPDLVIVGRAGKRVCPGCAGSRIKVAFQTRRNTFERFAYVRRASGVAEVAAGRVNADRRPDLYVLRRGRPGRDLPDLMLINRRDGRDFKSVPMPQTRRGKGDYVTNLDYDRNGRDDFVVLNGFHQHRGPVRLIASNP